LQAHIRSDRVPATVRRRASGLDGRSLLKIASAGDTAAVLSFVQAMFDFENAN